MIVKPAAKKIETPKPRENELKKLLGNVSHIDIHITKDNRK